MEIKKLSVILTLAMALFACDEGRIFDDTPSAGVEGLTAEASLEVSGWDLWPQGYSLALAAFSEANEYALISKNIEFNDEGKAVIVLTGIPADAYSVEFCVIDRLRRRVVTFCSNTEITASHPLTLTVEGVDVSPAQVIQSEIFNTTCINCHGGSNFAAAGLYLTSPKSFDELVDVQSVVKPSQLRVEPYNSSNSVLWQILSTDESAGWSYDHSVEVLASERLDLLKAWIDNGAKY